MITITKDEAKFIQGIYKGLTGWRIFDLEGSRERLQEITLRFINATDEDILNLDLVGKQTLEATLGISDFLYRKSMELVLSDIQYDTLEQKGNLLDIKPQMHMEFVNMDKPFSQFVKNEGDEPELFNPINVIDSFSGFENKPFRNAFLETSTMHKYLDLQGTIKKCRGIYKGDEYSIEEFINNLNKLKKGCDIVVVASKKYDGASMIVEFNKEGKVLQALSRGDDGCGRDLTKFVNHLNGAGLFDRDFGIAFESIVKYSDLKKLNELREKEGLRVFKNPRSAVVGILGDLEGERFKEYLTFVPLKKNGLIDRVRELESFKHLENNNSCVLNAGHYSFTLNVQDTLMTLNKLAEHFVVTRMQNDYMIDGMVVEIIGYIDRDNNNEFIDLRYLVGRDETNRVNRWEVAFKFTSEARTTELESVSFTVGATGKITPMVHFKEIEFSNGNLYTKASLGSIGKLKSLGLRIGDVITVEYANDVIPFVSRVETTKEDGERVSNPEICPCCGFRLNESESGELRCVNMKCDVKVIMGIPKALNILGGKNISEGTIAKLYDAGIIKSLEDIFDIESKRDAIVSLEGFGAKKFDMFVSEIKTLKEKKIGEQQVFGALNIADMGISTFKRLFRELDSNKFVFNVEKMWLLFDELLDSGLLNSRKLFTSIINCADEEKADLEIIATTFKSSEIKNNLMMSSTRLMKHILRYGIIEDLKKELNVNNTFDSESLIKDLVKVPGISSIKAISLVSSFTPDKIEQFKTLEKILNVSKTDVMDLESDKPFTVVFSGFRDKDNAITPKLESVGCNIVGSLTNKTDLLVIVDKSQITSKIKDAQKKGIIILSYSEVLNMTPEQLFKVISESR